MSQFSRATAIEQLEAKAFEVQRKLAEAGYAPFLFLVTLERLDQGTAGCFYLDSETVAVSEDYFKFDSDFCLNTVIPHEMAHLYVSKYFVDATEDHGKEFAMVMMALGLAPDATHTLPFLN